MKKLLAILLLCAGVTGYGQYNLTIESLTDATAQGTVYRFYVEANDPSDKISAVFGNDQMPLVFNTPNGIYNDPFNSSWNASGINSALFGFFPDLAYDSFATIGLDGPSAMVPGAEDPSLVEDASLSPTVSGYFQAGGTELNVNTLTGASWYVLTTAANALPDSDGRWLIAQITTDGSISGTINYLIFPLGEGANQIQKSFDFGGTGWGGPCEDLPYPFGCIDEAACNFDPCANLSDDSCLYLDDAGECTQSCLDPGDTNCVDPVLGCTYAMAINYDEDATEDDGSCLFEPCGDGTIWDETLNKCIVANPSDTDFDGCVGINDFLVHLSFYGSGCGPEPVWACGDPLEYQGYDYETVQIGGQCWFAENLRAENYRNGDGIIGGQASEDWSTSSIGMAAVYGEGDISCNESFPEENPCTDDEFVSTNFGMLYNWHAVADPRGVCPVAWHPSSAVDWTQMIEDLGGSESAVPALKSTFGWYASANGANTSGFGGLPSGRRHFTGYFAAAGQAGYFWTSTENGDFGIYRDLDYYFTTVGGNVGSKNYGFAVRCVKDTE